MFEENGHEDWSEKQSKDESEDSTEGEESEEGHEGHEGEDKTTTMMQNRPKKNVVREATGVKTSGIGDDTGETAFSRIRCHVQQMYGMDPRSLVALRVCISTIILFDIWGRVGPLNSFMELHAFYGPNGVSAM